MPKSPTSWHLECNSLVPRGCVCVRARVWFDNVPLTQSSWQDTEKERGLQQPQQHGVARVVLPTPSKSSVSVVNLAPHKLWRWIKCPATSLNPKCQSRDKQGLWKTWVLWKEKVLCQIETGSLGKKVCFVQKGPSLLEFTEESRDSRQPPKCGKNKHSPTMFQSFLELVRTPVSGGTPFEKTPASFPDLCFYGQERQRHRDLRRTLCVLGTPGGTNRGLSGRCRTEGHFVGRPAGCP